MKSARGLPGTPGYRRWGLSPRPETTRISPLHAQRSRGTCRNTARRAQGPRASWRIMAHHVAAWGSKARSWRCLRASPRRLPPARFRTRSQSARACRPVSDRSSNKWCQKTGAAVIRFPCKNGSCSRQATGMAFRRPHTIFCHARVPESPFPAATPGGKARAACPWPRPGVSVHPGDHGVCGRGQGQVPP